MSHPLRCFLAALLLCGAGGQAAADTPCRMAFDMGSSGIRAGNSENSRSARSDIDYLAPLLAGRGIVETIPSTIDALREMQNKAGLAGDCTRIGGGFSAWRMSLAEERGQLATALERIRRETGVSVLVVPQEREGRYGFQAAQGHFGGELRTTHILDIGGGSLQVAGESQSFGGLLGQKVWHLKLCRALRQTDSQPCALLPASATDLQAARQLAAAELQGLAAALPAGATMTAISRPVSRGILPALGRLAAGEPPANGFTREMLSSAIKVVASISQDELVARVGSPAKHAAYLLSDMLLVEGILEAVGTPFLHVAEADLTNIPGLLVDEQAFAWHDRYACYLDRLREMGLDAFASDPANCR